MTTEYIIGKIIKADTEAEALDLVEDTFYFLNYEKLDIQKSVDYDYIMRQMERKDWELHILRMTMILYGIDMDKVKKMTNNEAWMDEQKKRGYIK